MKFPKSMGAVVTGAGSGLGRALAIDLAQRGARIVVSDQRKETAEETATMVRALGAEAWVEVCDVSKPEEVMALAEAAERHVGEVDLLCNNAGVGGGGPFESITLEDWDWIIRINLMGVIYGCKAFMPAMRERGRGWVLNVASAAGLLRGPNMSSYNVTKVAVVGLSETLYAEYRKTGVHVSVLCPTFFRTNIMEDARGETDPRLKAMAERMMDRSKVQADGVAKAALDGCEQGDLYVVPMSDGRVMWAIKRIAPQRFHDLIGSGLLEKLAR